MVVIVVGVIVGIHNEELFVDDVVAREFENQINPSKESIQARQSNNSIEPVDVLDECLECPARVFVLLYCPSCGTTPKELMTKPKLLLVGQ